MVNRAATVRAKRKTWARHESFAFESARTKRISEGKPRTGKLSLAAGPRQIAQIWAPLEEQARPCQQDTITHEKAFAIG